MHPPRREQLVPNRVRPAGPHGNNRVAQNVHFMSIGAPAGRPIPMIALHWGCSARRRVGAECLDDLRRFGEQVGRAAPMVEDSSAPAVAAADDEHSRPQFAFECGGKPSDEPAVVEVRRKVEREHPEDLCFAGGSRPWHKSAPDLLVPYDGELTSGQLRRSCQRRFLEVPGSRMYDEVRGREDPAEASLGLLGLFDTDAHHANSIPAELGFQGIVSTALPWNVRLRSPSRARSIWSHPAWNPTAGWRDPAATRSASVRRSALTGEGSAYER